MFRCTITWSSARKTAFQQEYVAMLERGLVEYDERYLW
jgi:hypothetical protein